MTAAGTVRRRFATGSGRLVSGGTVSFVLALTGIAVGLIAVRASLSSIGFSYLAASPASLVIGLTAGWALLAVGIETRRRDRRRWFGSLLAVAGISWFLPEWSDPAIGQPVAFTLGLALGAVYPAVVGHALFDLSGMSWRIRLDPIVACGYVVFGIGLGVIPALAFDPGSASCGLCPPNLLGIGDWPDLAEAVTRIATALGVVWSAAAALALAIGLARSGPVTRRLRAPVLIPGIGFMILVAIALGRSVGEPIAPTDPIDRLLRIGQAFALAALAAGVAFDWVRARRSRARVAAVVADLADSAAGGGLRDQLAAILRDPQLQLAYPLGGGGLVDARGRPVDLGPRPGRVTTPVVRDDEIVAIIDHATDVLRDQSEVDEVVAAARLGLEHERLQADARAELELLRAARRRIVDAGDAHRKQLERDLHDGAQQHLIAISIGLRFVPRGPDVDASIDAAAAELRLAMDDLREVAHGIYPTVLGDEGFAAAVDALAEASADVVVDDELVDERFDGSIEVAAYHVVADVVRGSLGPFLVRARRTDDRLTIEVTAAQIPAEIGEEIEDRVGAVDGAIELVRDGGAAVTLRAEIPCGVASAASAVAAVR